MISPTAKRRLTKLADFMESLPAKAAEHFHMEDWVSHGGNHQHFKNGKVLDRKDFLTCGTTACALGWATAVPSFRKAGLRMVWRGNKFDTEVCLNGIVKRRYDVFNIAEKFFDIDATIARYLFRDIDAETPKQWAKVARAWVRASGR